MVQATFHFPHGFLWGTATSSHQVEGMNTGNNWWAWEQQPGRIQQGHTSGAACDWWSGRWREDFDRAANGGQNAHRLSIEWSRVQPAPDRWDEHAIDRYREMLRGLNERGLMPMVCLHHFSLPLWVEEQGGWKNPQIADWFVKYVRKLVEALREYATMWLTINEPNVLVSLAYGRGVFPPGEKGILGGMQVMTNLVKAHAGAYHAIHEIQPQARVGTAHQVRPFNPRWGWSPLDHFSTWLTDGFFNEFFPRAMTSGVLRFPFWRKRMSQAAKTQDFLGINYYTSVRINFSLLKAQELFGRHSFPPVVELSDSGDIANIPSGIYQAIRWGQKFNLPMIITENGLDDANDRVRPSYLLQHLHQLWRAVNFNWQVKGYFHWTLVDNFEWERGWTQRFGLWALDTETQRRSKRPSADLYAEICRLNGITIDMVERYAPHVLGQMFPGAEMP